MNKIIGCYALALTLATISPTFAGDTEGIKAATDGDYATAFEGDALFQLALMYHGGLGVDQNEAIAVQLYHKAAEKGNEMAQEYLAAGYENGWFGLPRSEELAAYYLEKAEESQRKAENEYEKNIVTARTRVMARQGQ